MTLFFLSLSCESWQVRLEFTPPWASCGLGLMPTDSKVKEERWKWPRLGITTWLAFNKFFKEIYLRIKKSMKEARRQLSLYFVYPLACMNNNYSQYRGDFLLKICALNHIISAAWILPKTRRTWLVLHDMERGFNTEIVHLRYNYEPKAI